MKHKFAKFVLLSSIICFVFLFKGNLKAMNNDPTVLITSISGNIYGYPFNPITLSVKATPIGRKAKSRIIKVKPFPGKKWTYVYKFEGLEPGNWRIEPISTKKIHRYGWDPKFHIVFLPSSTSKIVRKDFTWVYKPVDLIVSRVLFTETIYKGKKAFAVNVLIKNNGPGEIGGDESFKISIMLVDRNGIYRGGEKYSLWMRGLKPRSEKRAETCYFFFKPGVSEYRIKIKVDPFNEIKEGMAANGTEAIAEANNECIAIYRGRKSVWKCTR
jgi:hypothetical protein